MRGGERINPGTGARPPRGGKPGTAGMLLPLLPKDALGLLKS